MTQPNQPKEKGAIAFMARNSVAANLLMIILVVGGILMATQIKQEVFPNFDLDIVSIAVPYPGASPSEVEQGIILAIEEEVRGLDGVKEVRATANEGAGTVTVELLTGTNANKALQDIKNAVDRISSFPEDAERPTVSLLSNRREVISVILYGEIEDYLLRNLAEQVREDLLKYDAITTVDLMGVPPREISLEVPHSKLREYDLTLQEIANIVSRTAVEMPAGGVKTSGGEILLRTQERRDWASEFKDIPIISLPDGTDVQLGDIAIVKDEFRETDQETKFFGENAVRVAVYRIGNQKPMDVTAAVNEYIANLKLRLPDNVSVTTWEDSSEIYQDRINLLLRNAALGLILVLIILGLFLDIRLAFWVTLGIPISVLGSFLFIPAMDISINMISLFAFIVTLGIIVDDAVIVGENIFEYRQKGMPHMKAAIEGARNVAVPVSFSILTNIAAFMPMFFVPGTSGKLFMNIPAVVISVFIISWVESLYVLPAHLGHQKRKNYGGILGFIFRQQQKFTHGLDWFVEHIFGPIARKAIHFRYITLAIGIACLLAIGGLIGGGHLIFTFMPDVDTDVITANAVLPFGTPIEDTKAVQEKIVNAAEEVLSQYGGKDIVRGFFMQIGSTGGGMGPGAPSGAASGSHLTNVQVNLVPSDQRPITATQFAKEWGDAVGEIPGLESLSFQYSAGPPTGDAIDIELSHPDIEILERAAAEVAESLYAYQGVRDINDGFERGKLQFDLELKPEARALGLTTADLANQVRSAFYGARAIRQQRGRDEIWVMVRLPEEERESRYNIERLLIRTPQGGEIPLRQAAEINIGRAYTKINRTEGRRVVNVTADVLVGVTSAGQVIQDVEENVLPSILAKYPRLTYSLEGEQREQQESLSALGVGYIFCMFVIFALLAVPFRSYVQPFIVMIAIPFGIVGAVLGHLLMGYNLSIISMFGIVALTGVVVNDSLVLISTANENRALGLDTLNAITLASKRRFRPILLTSLTTFFGLAPMIFETSVQARFLIPMAISLGYGILFATVIALLLVPALYMIIEDLAKLTLLIFGRDPEERDEEFQQGDDVLTPSA